MGLSLRKRNGKNIRAIWREGGRRVEWNTGTKDEKEAERLALEERLRRIGGSSAPPAPASIPQAPSAPLSPSSPPPAADPRQPPGRRPIAEAVARAIGKPEQLAQVIPISPAAAAAQQEREAKAAKVRRLYEVGGKMGALGIEGALKRLYRWAGRDAAEMDDEEQALIGEGFGDKLREWFGDVQLGPWGKVALGTSAAAVGMWMGGKPIPKPKTQPAPASTAAPGDKQQQGGGGA